MIILHLIAASEEWNESKFSFHPSKNGNTCLRQAGRFNTARRLARVRASEASSDNAR